MIITAAILVILILTVVIGYQEFIHNSTYWETQEIIKELREQKEALQDTNNFLNQAIEDYKRDRNAGLLDEHHCRIRQN